MQKLLALSSLNSLKFANTSFKNNKKQISYIFANKTCIYGVLLNLC